MNITGVDWGQEQTTKLRFFAQPSVVWRILSPKRRALPENHKYNQANERQQGENADPDQKIPFAFLAKSHGNLGMQLVREKEHTERSVINPDLSRTRENDGAAILPIAEESRTHTVLSGKYLHLRQKKYSQYLILLRIFSLHLRNICSRKTAQHPPALYFLMDFVKASRSKIRILQDEIWRKTRKILAAGRMSSALFGYICDYHNCS